MNPGTKDNIVLVVCLFVMLVIGGMIGVEIGRQAMRRSAIKAGVAEWRCDPETGKTSFQWKK